MLIREIIDALEELAPPVFQESYDNSGLITGDPNAEARAALVSLDCTEEVVAEAVSRGCNLIISHHPIIFSGLKHLTTASYVERTVVAAIKNDIAIYACHTNLDHVRSGVNHRIAQKLGLVNAKILLPKEDLLRKLVTFVPASHHKQVLDALFRAGAGHIGDYDSCSFNLEGEGTFRGGAGTQPFLGKPGELSTEKETRIEVIFHRGQQKPILAALREAHPYEEIAYDIYALHNSHPNVGSGMVGELKAPLGEKEFLDLVKKTFKAGVLRHTALRGKPVKKVAICGGSGRFLLKNAIGAGADAFVTADFKYHEFFDVEGRLLLVDTGHFESEQFTPEIFSELLNQKFSTFAVHLSKTNTNPVHYF